MKKLLLLTLGVFFSLLSFAQDFTYEYQGQTLTYTVVNEVAKTCKTKAGTSNESGNKVTGVLVIPETANGYKVVEIGDSSFLRCDELTSLVIPESVTYIGVAAFCDCSRLIAVEIPNSVTTIEDLAFASCISMTSVVIGNSVSYIGDKAFAFCNTLNSITVTDDNHFYCSIDGVLYTKDISTLVQYPGGKDGVFTVPNSVSIIGNSAFSSCINLTSVKFSNSVINIGNSAFLNCTNLETVELSCRLKTIGECAFWRCFALKSLEIPNSVTSIGDGAFYRCYGLDSLYIPSSVTSIGDYAFSNCRGLTSIDIPNTVKTIGDFAFSTCRNLTSVYYNSTSPINCNGNVFYAATYKNATLYIPQSAVEKCKEIDPWKNFTNIVANEFSGIEEIEDNVDSTCSYEVYDLRGVKVGDNLEDIAPGLYIRKQGTTTKKIIVK